MSIDVFRLRGRDGPTKLTRTFTREEAQRACPEAEIPDGERFIMLCRPGGHSPDGIGQGSASFVCVDGREGEFPPATHCSNG